MEDPDFTDTVTSFIASATSSAWEAVTTGLGDSPFDWNGGDVGYTNSTNGTLIPVPPPVDAPVSEGSYILNTLIGLIIVLVASVLNAFGLNLTKLDHMRQQAIPKRERRKEYLRLLWLAGMGTYIASQVFGSPLALRYLRPDWVAPLGSSSLIFNFMFAHWLVGTPVTPTDIRGTGVIVLGVILILIFSSINHGLTQSVTIELLNSLWGRGAWLAYFALLVVFTSTTYFSSNVLAMLLASRASYSPLPSPEMELGRGSRGLGEAKGSLAVPAFLKKVWGGWKRIEHKVLVQVERILARTDDPRVIWLQGIGWAVAGGSLAGLCLVFTKAVVKILWLPGHPLIHFTPLLSLLLVIGTAVLQIVCLNRALQCADTVVVVPLFYAGYTVFGFVNSLIFFNETGQYPTWVLVMTFVSIGVLISGVVLLSLKSSAKTAADPYDLSASTPQKMRLRPRRGQRNQQEEGNAEAGPSSPGLGKVNGVHDGEEEEEGGEEGHSGSGKQAGKGDVLWEVGSVSDDSENGDAKDDGKDEDGEEERRGVGGGKGSRGERRGLLDEEDGDAEPEADRSRGSRPPATPIPGLERNPFAESEDPDDSFGDFAQNEAGGSKR